MENSAIFFKATPPHVLIQTIDVTKKSFDIVIVRLDALGDFILWAESARQLRNYFRDRHITLIANSAWAEIAMELPFFDHIEIVDLSFSSKLDMIKMYFLIRKNFSKSTANVLLHPTISRTTMSDYVVKQFRCNNIVGWTNNSNNYRGRLSRIPGLRYSDSNKFYSTLLRYDPALMELESNNLFVSYILGHQTQSRITNLSPYFSDIPTVISGDYIVLAPFASDPKKSWPVTRFLSLFAHMPQSMPIVVCGSRSNIDESKRFNTQQSSHTIYNMVGKTSLIELTSIVKNAKFVIGNDSAILHLASSFQIPSLGIVGGGHFGRFLPYKTESATNFNGPNIIFSKMECFGCNWECKYTLTADQKWPCIDAISSDVVGNQFIRVFPSKKTSEL